MIDLRKRTLLAVAVAAGLGCCAPAMAMYHSPSVRIDDAWCPPTPPGAPTAAGYLTISNLGHAPDRLLGASTPAAAEVQLHSMTVRGGVMRMRLVATGLAIAPGQKVSGQPGGDHHLMLIGLKHALKVGEHVPVTLSFEHAGAVRTDFLVRPREDMAPAMHTGLHDHRGGR